jgi:hypothetical protein
MKKLFFPLLLASLILMLFFPVKKTCAADSQTLEINLSYEPARPYNDPSGNNPMELKVSSYVLYAETNENYMNYNWKVYGSNNKDSASWKEVLKSSLVDSSPLIGFGLKQIKFKLALNDPAPKYLKVKLNVSENNNSGAVNTGEGEIIIPIPSVSSEIKVFSTTADTNGSDNPLRLTNERCTGDNEKSICPVVKNEILGLKIDSSKLTDFVWSVDDAPIVYNKCFYSNCNTDENNFTYLPILKNAGETYSLTLQAKDKSTGEKLQVNRLFQVVSPSILISSADETTCQPMLLGYFKDLDNNLTPDYSPDVFEAKTGTSLSLKPNFSVPFSAEIIWNIDGMEITKDNAANFSIEMKEDGTITLPLNREAGYSFPISLSSFYSQPNETKKVLNEYWQVGLNDFYEKPIDATIKINVVSALRGEEVSENTVPKNIRNKFLATLISNVPAQLFFLAKLAFVSVLILFGSQFLLSLFSKENEAPRS